MAEETDFHLSTTSFQTAVESRDQDSSSPENHMHKPKISKPNFLLKLALDQTPSAEMCLKQQDAPELIHECLKQKAANLQPGQPLLSCHNKGQNS